MKILGINGSPRKNGNTASLIMEAFKPLEKEGIETELYQLGGKQVHGCTACMKCREEPVNQCHIKNNAVNECITKMIAADAIILGSPVYFSDVTTEMKALIDCAGYVMRAGDNTLRRKIGAAVVAVRRTGGMHTFETLNNFFLINEMIVPGSSYWNIGIGRNPGDVLEDKEGLKTMYVLGENIGYLLKNLKR
jgi:multimeric flavodoxin WrbA